MSVDILNIDQPLQRDDETDADFIKRARPTPEEDFDPAVSLPMTVTEAPAAAPPLEGFNPDTCQRVVQYPNGGELWVGNKIGAARFEGEILCVLEEPHCQKHEKSHHIAILVDGVAKTERLDEAAAHIQQQLDDGKKILVHCSAGFERSPLTIAWWLVKRRVLPNMKEAYKLLQTVRPIVANREIWLEKPAIDLPHDATEQQKYEAMWTRDEYRGVSPGEQIAAEFLNVVRPRNHSHIIDFGAGTGRGSLMIAILANMNGQDVEIDMLDFAANALDEDVKNTNQPGATKLRFTQHDLTKPVPFHAPYGFCTDVMEHIPPEQIDQVLVNILQAAQHVFFQISCTDDSCGKLIGHALHLSVHEPAWWKKKFEDLGCVIHHWTDLEHTCIAYVTAWSDGQDVVDIGELNAAEKVIRENVRTNVKGGWHQVMPHHPQSTEVMILGGGPSLAGQLDTIRRMRFEGKKIVTLNGAYNWAIENGLGHDIGCQIVVDARPHNARFTKPVMPQAIYLIGSQCDPSVLEGLPKERTLLWHTTAEIIKDILEEECPGKWFGVSGGSTVLLRAIPLLRMLGYTRFHLFGMDSCLDEGRHHAYEQSENDGNQVFPVSVGGKIFHCHAWMCSQAQEFITLVKVLGDLFELEIHGGGLLSWILQHAADVDIEIEEAKETAKG